MVRGLWAGGSEEEAAAAAAGAQLGDTIAGLPQGLRTRVGERLSERGGGGRERQETEGRGGRR